MTDPREFWNMRSRNYDDQVGPLYEDAYTRTANNTLKYLKPGDQVLDFACGTGIVTLQLAPHVAHIRAIDISDEMVAQASKKLEGGQFPNVEITQTDLFDPCLEPETFDAVTAFNVLCYVDDPARVFARIRELLKPGGMFLSATDCLGQKPTKAGLKKFWKSRTGSMPYVAFYTMKGLERTIAQNGFAVLDRENLFPAPPNLFVAAQKE
ncbi:class I SAM-dependent methyltransferase [Pseudoflavonifractor phocaeensis]|uniref:class I SAM-dependent methyltransferase n=1 Tax=Pseudoflavonifractor phocaeensis TaxID=1870988 RepID=UPI001F23171A|nr:class I SAM-dependent methyltransferase [Pseudoflavonifractor phocaeensis]MCF2660533.1 class I SAM-dependent methyltransferase [Pseudoflavonifractor phocaeensis]